MSGGTHYELPPVLTEIADVTSLGTALRLASEKGGQRVTIPATAKDDHWLTELVGLDDARAISDYFTHGRAVQIEVPIMHGSILAQRRALFEQLKRDGLSNNEIASRMQITNRAVRLRSQSAKAAPLPLFDTDKAR
ncbi:MAG: helix-turn-helix domain-containing protein [Pseudomonadota bacterium]